MNLVPFYLTKMPFYLLYIITFITNYISHSLLILQWKREERRFKIKMNKKHYTRLPWLCTLANCKNLCKINASPNVGCFYEFVVNSIMYIAFWWVLHYLMRMLYAMANYHFFTDFIIFEKSLNEVFYYTIIQLYKYIYIYIYILWGAII